MNKVLSIYPPYFVDVMAGRFPSLALVTSAQRLQAYFKKLFCKFKLTTLYIKSYQNLTQSGE